MAGEGTAKDRCIHIVDYDREGHMINHCNAGATREFTLSAHFYTPIAR